jgi:lycopene beta-cyclase
MSYMQFHLYFLAPPLLLLAWAARPAFALLGRRAAWSLPAICVIAFIYTTPWDNYLVANGIWWYGPDRVIGTIGYVPVEEYLFFLLQPLLTGLWMYVLLARMPDSGRAQSPATPPEPAITPGAHVRVAGALAYAAAALLGVVLLQSQAGTYMGLILAWAAPVLAVQWALAGDEVTARMRVWLPAVAVPTVYLWIADTIAIRSGIWQISEAHTLGPRPFGLPIEEATFFLVTNLLVAQGLMLFLFYRPGVRATALGTAA